jgi:hypothetical protein
MDQTHRGDLDEVFQRLAPASEATGDMFSYRKIAGNQLLAKLRALGILHSESGVSLVQRN